MSHKFLKIIMLVIVVMLTGCNTDSRITSDGPVSDTLSITNNKKDILSTIANKEEIQAILQNQPNPKKLIVNYTNITGEWVSPQKFSLMLASDSTCWIDNSIHPRVEGVWLLLADTIVMYLNNNTVKFSVETLTETELILNHALFELNPLTITLCNYPGLYKIFYRNTYELEITEESLAGHWGELSLEDTMEYSDCCSDGKWRVETIGDKNFLVMEMESTNMNDGFDKSTVMPISYQIRKLTRYTLSLYLRKGYENHYFRIPDVEKDNFILPIINESVMAILNQDNKTNTIDPFLNTITCRK